MTAHTPVPDRTPVSTDPGASRAEALQRSYGNRAVERLVDADLAPVSRRTTSSGPDVDQTYETVTGYRLSATIRQSPQAADPGDTPPGTDGERETSPASTNSDPDSQEVGDDEVVTELEDGALLIEEGDSVNTAMTYTPTITNTPTPPGADLFGLTRTKPAVSGIAVVHDAAAGIFNVTASITNKITWSVHSRGRTNIPDKNDGVLTQDNYTDVAADLTPDMSSDNGRPPRDEYWAQDLTTRHEKFHANERATTYGNPAFNFAQNWLANQTADDAASATALAKQVPAKMNESYAASYSPGKESRAYGDGAQLYKARADAILAKGAARGYAIGEADLYQPGGEMGFA